MSYQVLARKWRPKIFSALVGQEHVVQALVNGLDNDRLHHAFLFTGTRGVGKTTIARIFSKALNCVTGVSSEPCGTCDVCREVDEGRFVDLIEVDAASRTKVDDTRDLLDNVQYAPSRGRYKVYLIDEVHMLSTHSFNALLKTLEEPPPHVKFLLATTDPQKLPVTVLSRCLQFNLRRLAPEQIESYLAKVLEAEGVAFEAEALRGLALAADGSMRDALSLLDQALAYGAGRLVLDEVNNMLGTVDRSQLDAVARALAAADADALWQAAQELISFGPDYGAVLRDLAALFHRVAVAQMVPDARFDTGDEALVAELAAMNAEDVQLVYEIAVQGRAALDIAPDARSGFEMTLLRMLAFRPDVAGPTAPPAGQPQRQSAPAADSGGRQARTTTRPAAEATAHVTDSALAGDVAGDWAALIDRLGLRGPAAVLAANSLLEPQGEGHYRLVVAKDQSHLRTPRLEEKIRSAMARLFGKDVRVDFVEREAAAMASPAARQHRELADRQQRAQEAIDSDPVVRDLKNRFDATVVPESVKPLNN